MTAAPPPASAVVEDGLIALSALQHWAYCPRQCGLIHLEQAFDDNLHTQRGQAVHALVDKPGVEERKGLRIERALPLWSDVLGMMAWWPVQPGGPKGRARGRLADSGASHQECSSTD